MKEGKFLTIHRILFGLKGKKNEFIKNELPGKQKNIPLFDEIVNSKSTKKVMNKATTQPIILHFYPNFKQTSSQTKWQTEKSKLCHHQLSWLPSTITFPEFLHSVQGKRKITKIISNTLAICSAYRLKKELALSIHANAISIHFWWVEILLKVQLFWA